MGSCCLKCYIYFSPLGQFHLLKGTAGNQTNKVRGYIHGEIEDRALIGNMGDYTAKGITGAGVEWLGGDKNIFGSD